MTKIKTTNVGAIAKAPVTNCMSFAQFIPLQHLIQWETRRNHRILFSYGYIHNIYILSHLPQKKMAVPRIDSLGSYTVFYNFYV